MLRIGLTGGIATGKSTVSNYLKELDYPLIDADVIARQLVEPGQEGLKRLVAKFGAEILNESGALDRQALGQRLFGDAQLRQEVDQLLHPLIYEALEAESQRLAQAGAKLAFFDIPLLYETGYDQKMDQVWVVYLPHDLQVERLMARNSWSQDQAEAAIASQASIEAKRQRADLVIDNQGSLAVTFAQVDQALSRL
ncbi:dephospho-CoA kinase [Abiotrophia defectiva]